MSILLQQIKTDNWQLSTAGVGIVAEGLADIRQCLDVLFRTRKGSSPLRPEFGCDLFQYIDKPLNTAIPNIVRSIIDAAEIWEKRVVVESVTYQLLSPSHVKFFVTYSLVDTEVIDMLVIYLNGGYVNYEVSQMGGLTLYCLLPVNPAQKKYLIAFEIDGQPVAPVCPQGGFAALGSMLNWVKANWGGYGTWLLGADRITLQAISTITSGGISMSLTGTLRFSAALPTLQPAQEYALTFNPNGGPPAELIPSSFSTMAEMLNWVQNNLAAYGSWSIEGNADGPGDFDSGDWDEADFFTGTPGEYALVLYSNSLNECELIVTAV